jgi:hypothetical protein
LQPFPLGHPMAKIKLPAIGSSLHIERALTHVAAQRLLDTFLAVCKGFCRKFCAGGAEGAVALVRGGITRPGRRTVRPW